MICYQCVERLDFLKSYSGLAVSPGSRAGEDSQEVKVKDGAGSEGDGNIPAGGGCRLKPPPPDTQPTSLFFPSKWRKNLCRCVSCVEMYSANCITFLADQ